MITMKLVHGWQNVCKKLRNLLVSLLFLSKQQSSSSNKQIQIVWITTNVQARNTVNNNNIPALA